MAVWSEVRGSHHSRDMYGLRSHLRSRHLLLTQPALNTTRRLQSELHIRVHAARRTYRAKYSQPNMNQLAIRSCRTLPFISPSRPLCDRPCTSKSFPEVKRVCVFVVANALPLLPPTLCHLTSTPSTSHTPPRQHGTGGSQ
jgi:hypothetical protein